ncbi:MAG: hypothetical protein V1707_00095 [bacterium]
MSIEQSSNKEVSRQEQEVIFAKANIDFLKKIPEDWKDKDRLQLINGLAGQLDKHIFNNAVIDLTKDLTFLNLNQIIAIVANDPSEKLEELRSRFEKTINAPRKEPFFMMEP